MAGRQLRGNKPLYQLFDSSGNPTPTVGAFLLQALADHPDRFMLGVDTKTQYATEREISPGEWEPGISTYADFVPVHGDFLDQVGWYSDTAVENVRHLNVAGLL